MMSDYEVSLVNDSMQEFCVHFYGPSESKLMSTLSCKPGCLTVPDPAHLAHRCTPVIISRSW